MATSSPGSLQLGFRRDGFKIEHNIDERANSGGVFDAWNNLEHKAFGKGKHSRLFRELNVLRFFFVMAKSFPDAVDSHIEVCCDGGRSFVDRSDKGCTDEPSSSEAKEQAGRRTKKKTEPSRGKEGGKNKWGGGRFDDF